MSGTPASCIKVVFVALSCFIGMYRTSAKGCPTRNSLFHSDRTPSASSGHMRPVERHRASTDANGSPMETARTLCAFFVAPELPPRTTMSRAMPSENAMSSHDSAKASERRSPPPSITATKGSKRCPWSRESACNASSASHTSNLPQAAFGYLTGRLIGSQGNIPM